MEYTNAAAWLQGPIADLQSVHDERPSSSTDDWKEQAASVQGGGINDLLGDIQGEHDTLPKQTPATSDAFSCQSSLQSLISSPVQNAPSTSTNSPGSTFFLPHLYLASATNPFSTVQYSPGPWPSASSQLPLSSYSSLNGATSTSHPQSQSQQPSNNMVIDPALTTMNGSSASPPQQYQQSAFFSSQPQSRMTYQYSHHQHTPTLSINPSFVHANPQHFHQSQPQHSIPLPRHHSHSPPQPTQGTLSPFVLHSPTSTIYAGIPPSSFYGQPPHSQAGSSSILPSSTSQTSTSPVSTPQLAQALPQVPQAAPAPPKVPTEQQRAELARGLKPLIQPSSFTGAGAVSQLVNLLDDFGIPKVDNSTRFEILTKIRDNAGNHYFRAWVDNEIAMDIIQEWLKLAFVGRNEAPLVETIMPLLHIVDRLPLTIEKLKVFKLGKLIMRLMKDPPTPAIKDMASNLERKWRKMLNSEVSEKMDTENTEDAKGKKRRAESTTAKGAPPIKKAAVPGASTTTPKAVPVKKESKPVVKDAKSDSSFFSKPKPTKKEMPSFKKNAPAAAVASLKKEPDLNVAQPSSVNPFEELLKSFGSSSAGASASTSTPPPGSSIIPPAAAASPSAAAASTSSKTGKPKKSVTWAPDGRLEQIKFIERAIYDDDPTSGSHPTHNIRDLDRGEGAALHAHLFDEQIEWAEPQPLEMPPEIQITPRGEQSEQRKVQEDREQSALVAQYSSPVQIPDSPAEPASQIPEEQVDEGVCVMLTGPEMDTIFWSDGAPALVDTIRPSASVAELVGQLTAGLPDVMMGDATQTAAAMQNAYPNVSGINAEQLQQLMQQAQALSQGVFGGLGSAAAALHPPQSQPGDAAQGWGPGNQYSEFDRGYHENGGRGGDTNRRWNEDGWGTERGGPPRGRGLRGGPGRGLGRGRGDGYRSTKRKPCSFFQAGRCRYGDQCDFSHELLPY